jgi:hypothetical protein
MVATFFGAAWSAVVSMFRIFNISSESIKAKMDANLTAGLGVRPADTDAPPMVSSTVDPGVLRRRFDRRDRWLRRTAVSWAIGLIASLLMLYYSYSHPDPGDSQGFAAAVLEGYWLIPMMLVGIVWLLVCPLLPPRRLALYEHGIGVGECFIAFVDLARIECDRRIELSFRSKYDFDNYVTEWRFHGKDGSIAEYVVRYSRRKDPFVEMDDFNDALRAAGIALELNEPKLWQPSPAWAKVVGIGIVLIITAVVLGIQWALGLR